MKLGNAFVHLYKLDDSLRGHEMIVASTNNKAVENVSKELPLYGQIAQDIEGFEYFKTVSDALSDGGEETWGLCAAVLGNAKNRSKFINTAWWDDDTGLRKYFLSITGQLNLEVDDDGNDIIPRILEECNPPSSIEDAKRRWDFACREFEETLTNAQAVIDKAQKSYEASIKAVKLEVEIQSLLTDEAQQKTEINNAKERYASLEKDSGQKKSKVDQLKTWENDLKATKPGFFKRLFSRSKWKEWKVQYSALRTELSGANKDYKLAQSKANECGSELSKLHHAISHTQEKISTLHSQRVTLLAEIEKYSPICGNKLVTSGLWALEHDQQQVFSPNFTIEAQCLRDDVFVAAVRLHKAFIDAASKQLRQNLGAFFSVLSGKGLPEDKQALLPHLWSSAFLLTPVMSTAFASVGRMFKPMPKESIGWLLIDEAGQATPQAAIGAIYRSKRVMCVGDPLQIEPVVTLPSLLVEGISKHFGVDPFHWMAPDASVQTLSDNANVYGTTIPRELSEIRIGSPLLVHRRCEDPMFTISNRLAYNGLMAQATVSRESDITSLFGKQSEWFDIQGSAQEKWCPEEGEVVAEMLLKRIAETNGDPEIYVISPFRIVAERMSQRMRMEENTLIQHGIVNPNDWIYNNIGTVHTFQGKETKAVILLLGAPNPAQTGARSWATSNVNLLNVAVSRAKQNFYVVGNKSLWGELGNMKLVARLIGK
nr:DEAD/DEAH box helicase [uncultured Desulfobacter sp.]